MKRLIPSLFLLVLLCAGLVDQAQAQDIPDALDSLRTEAVRSRGFIRGAETQLSKVISIIDTIDELRTDTMFVPQVDTFEVIVTDTVLVSRALDSLQAIVDEQERTIALLFADLDSLSRLPRDTVRLPYKPVVRPILPRADSLLVERRYHNGKVTLDAWSDGRDSLIVLYDTAGVDYHWLAVRGDSVTYQFWAGEVTVPTNFYRLIIDHRYNGNGENRAIDLEVFHAIQRHVRANHSTTPDAPEPEPEPEPEPDPDPDPEPEPGPLDVPTEGLIAWYTFDGPIGANVQGGAELGTAGNVTQVDGLRGRAASLPGQGGTYLYADLIDVETGDVTISVWVRARNIHNTVISSGRYAVEPAIAIGFTNATPRLQLGDGVRSFEGQAANNVMGRWMMATLVIDRAAAVATLYIDGQPGRTHDISGWGSLSTRSRFGIGKTPGSWSGWLDGDVDELMAWDRALTAEEVQTLFDSFAP